MKPRVDRRKCLQELEGKDWGETDDDSYLVQTCHRLRRVPLAEFTTEDLRIMIGQKIGLLFLVPLALETLRREPLAEGRYYPGDLLGAVLSVPDSFWRHHPDMRDMLRAVIAAAREILRSMDETDAQPLRCALARARGALLD